MNKKVFLALILLMSLSLIGIIIVQGFWIKNTVESNEDQFSYSARQVLINVAEQIERQEVDEYYVQYATIANQSKPTSTTLSELFQINKDDLDNETFIYSTVLQEDYKLASPFLSGDRDSIAFKKLVNQRVSRVVRNEQVEGDLKNISAEERFKRISRLEENEKILLSEAIKEKASELPIYKRVDTTELRRLIEAQLEARDIKSKYEFGIFSNELATKVKTENFKQHYPSTYGIPIFESPTTNYKLLINFTGKKKEIFSSIVLMIILSVAFTLIIIVAYASTISQLIRQRQISQIKTDFINNMTHEFKTPIATINLALDAVKNPKVASDATKVDRYLKMIKEENRRMHAQVENVLRISKLERNELNLDKERLKLHDLIEDAIMHVELIVEEKQGYINTHFEAKKSSILANESHFTNVIVNILDNAIKYSPGQPKIDIYTENVKNYIVLKIKDQGKGMSKNVQKKVFEKFYREHTGDVHDIKGHGLGLAYVKQIVEDHHGQVVVESEKHVGSTFIIKLPLIS